MTKRVWALPATALIWACGGTTPPPPPTVITPSFFPDRNPPVVPSPTDLVQDATTGRLAIDQSLGVSDADRELITYLDTLNGYPPASTAAVTFTGKLDPATVTAQSVRVLDITDAAAPVPVTASLHGLEQPDVKDAPFMVTVDASWAPGHRYAIAVLGGASGVKGAGGESVVATQTWALIRSANPLAVCSDAGSCLATTDLLPPRTADGGITLDDGGILDTSRPADYIRGQGATAALLEGLRLHYKPTLDALASSGVARTDVAVLWTFGITNQTSVVFDPKSDPPHIPLPTDLARDPVTGLLNVPLSASLSPAEREFTRDYLNTLHGFPQETGGSAEISGGDLDPASVTAETVRVRDLSPGSDGGVPFDAAISYDSTAHKILITPPGGLWPKGHTFQVTLVGGPGGLRTPTGDEPRPSVIWALMRSRSTLTTCADLTDPSCKPALTLVPMATADAVQLEGFRRQFAPLLDQLDAQGLPREHIPAMWTFTIAPNPVAYFDPVNSVVPLPNELVRVPADGGTPAHIAIPLPDGGPQALIDTIAQVNALDGFSTTQAAVSVGVPPGAGSFAQGPLDQGLLDPASLDGGAGFVRVGPGAPPQVTVCLNCASSPLLDGGAQTTPQSLQFVPTVPLEEKTQYAGYLTTDLTDQNGAPVISTAAFALMRSSAPLVDSAGHATVSVISDAQAQQLEPARQTLKPFLDALEAQGIPRSKLVLAFGFTTQSISDSLPTLATLPQQRGTTTALGFLSQENVVLTGVPPVAAGDPYPHGNIRNFYMGSLTVPNALHGPGGTFDPASVQDEQIRFFLAIPSGTKPATGYPVVIWVHPITASSISLLAVADPLAANGFATMAIDLPFHGMRSSCKGAKDAFALPGATSDDAACASGSTCDETTGKCTPMSCTTTVGGDGTCISADQGRCLGTNGLGLGGTCEGPGFAQDPSTHAAVISGWNMISSNLFSTRDNFRQSAVDLAQLERVLNATGANTLAALLPAGDQVNGKALNVVALDFGGWGAAMAASQSANIHRLVLNAPGADLATLLVNGLTPAARDQFLQQAAGLGFTRGTMGFDQQVVGTMQWVMDPADLANQLPFALGSPSAPADRKVMIQYITNDPIVPFANTERVIAASAQAGTSAVVVENDAPAGLTGVNRHTYLLSADAGTVTTTAQTQMTNFLTTGAP